ncbi:ferredoxin [Candidatus Endoriftia persephone str. Guaymas]|jgi:nitrate reductase NapD|uniref:Chaperone NapD n=4 Tax=Gammaproteobacteria TaxID=1236 RepID=G2FFF4_9GAMM|nr:chaperone NapD [Candidatus Endoriftia persephone]MBA1330616.1 ferredoxin [Candidatus Endoriftia persephone str. Guaymas]EGV52159.1 protein NapD [endosymbiont of Riftia pachyptila (vent Ph05)]EGW54532.1 protein NapD [endosymbiont of Tevnia jerichonana (vent Tica)]KRT56395.1 periplasmic nitrate reductase chaperone NapD [endosymbiont of Ridgeia piscesae]KRT59365.1 periplasmic nitrate reductase chaperone NapD [endosymbiont of Ridgeia piscesae]
MNICSLVVHTKPENGAVVSQRLAEMTGVEVHGGEDVGKLIVTVEDEGEELSPVSDTMNALRDVEGVVSTVLIYHYGGEESMEEMKREIN